MFNITQQVKAEPLTKYNTPKVISERESEILGKLSDG